MSGCERKDSESVHDLCAQGGGAQEFVEILLGTIKAEGGCCSISGRAEFLYTNEKIQWERERAHSCIVRAFCVDGDKSLTVGMKGDVTG